MHDVVLTRMPANASGNASRTMSGLILIPLSNSANRFSRASRRATRGADVSPATRDLSAASSRGTAIERALRRKMLRIFAETMTADCEKM